MRNEWSVLDSSERQSSHQKTDRHASRIMLQKEYSDWIDIYSVSEFSLRTLSHGQLSSSVLVVIWAVPLKCNPTQW